MTGSVAREEIAALCRRDDLRAVLTVLAEWSLIVGAIAAAGRLDGPVWYLLAVLVIGTRQYALGECLVHEASHRNLSRSRLLNDFLGVACAWPFFFALGAYRRFHNRLHHGIELSDPDNSIREDYEDWGLPQEDLPLGATQALWHFLGRPLLGLIGLRHLVKTVQDFYWDGDLLETRLMLAAWVLVLASAAAAGLLLEVAAYWLVPYVTVYAVLNYWSEVGDHYHVSGAETRSDLNWFLNTFVSHNIGYHALHHRYPGIPWFRLPRAYDLLKEGLVEQKSSGYLATFRQIVAASADRKVPPAGPRPSSSDVRA